MALLIKKTAAEFVSENPILTLNQIGQESDAGLMKVGDGVTAWNTLLYDYSTPVKNAFEQFLSGLKYKVPSSFSVAQSLAPLLMMTIDEGNQLSTFNEQLLSDEGNNDSTYSLLSRVFDGGNHLSTYS